MNLLQVYNSIILGGVYYNSIILDELHFSFYHLGLPNLITSLDRSGPIFNYIR